MPAEISGFTTEPLSSNANTTFAVLNASGTVGTTAGSNILTGTGTFFTSQLAVGKIVTFGQYAYTVQSITNDTQAILTENYLSLFLYKNLILSVKNYSFHLSLE
jgi:hypothetical protein